MKECLLSIVIPVYNAEKYIGECLDSLLLQGLSEDTYEIICVNDGSTDTSSAVLEEYQIAHPQIVLINKENGGVSSARNAGIKVAKGKFLAFVDADDCIIPNAFGEIITFLCDNHLESASYPFQYFYNDRDYTIPTKIEITVNKNSEPTSSANVFTMILKREIISKNNIVFNETMKLGEDTLFMYYVGNEQDFSKHCSVRAPIYCYRQHLESTMHRKNNDFYQKHMEDMMTMAECYNKELPKFRKDDWRYKNTLLRRDKAVMSLMYDAVILKNIEPHDLLDRLRAKKLYPTKLAWWTLKKAKAKVWINNILCFLFPFSWYYVAFVKIFRKLKKIN